LSASSAAQDSTGRAAQPAAERFNDTSSVLTGLLCELDCRRHQQHKTAQAVLPSLLQDVVNDTLKYNNRLFV
jgi:hypothetical protein